MTEHAMPPGWSRVRCGVWWDGVRKIYDLHALESPEEAYVISIDSVWAPGSYATMAAALRAFDLTEEQRSELAEAARDGDGLITLETIEVALGSATLDQEVGQ
jgi:hypothetical protein